MKDDRLDTELDDSIRASMKLIDEPSPELNQRLKAALYQRESAIRNAPATRSLSLWYIPMIFNLITSFTLAAAALVGISNTCLSYFAAGICLYIGLAGVLLTIIGLKRTNIKEELTIRVQKRGAAV